MYFLTSPGFLLAHEKWIKKIPDSNTKKEGIRTILAKNIMGENLLLNAASNNRYIENIIAITGAGKILQELSFIHTCTRWVF